MRKERHNYTAEDKVVILKRHLLERVAVSDICDEYKLQPKAYYSWQKQLFENKALAFKGKMDKVTEQRHNSVIIQNKIYSITSRDAFNAGTKVRYLSPDKVSKEYIRNFQMELLTTCGFNKKFLMQERNIRNEQL